MFDAEFWVMISLFGFIAFMLYFRVPAMATKALDKRAEAIRQELDEARRLREEAQAVLAEYQRKRRNAEKEAEDIVVRAKKEAESYAAETRKALKDSLARRMQTAEDKIAQAESQAVQEVRAAAVNVAVSAAQSVIEKNLTATAAKKLVDDSIKDVSSRLN